MADTSTLVHPSQAAVMPLSLPEQLQACRARVQPLCNGLSAPYPAFTLIFSISDGRQRAQVLHTCADDFDTAWRQGAQQTLAAAQRHKLRDPWLRVDWVDDASDITWGDFEAQLSDIKRNHFRLGLALDSEFRRVLTEQELNANAMLYGGPQVTNAQFNRNNFEIYLWRRYAHEPAADFDADRLVHLLTTRGVFCQADGAVHLLADPGPGAGRREMPALDSATTAAMIRSASSFLTRQVQAGGQFVYGHFPCFDRRIGSYNTLRHASTLHAMLEAWELNRDAALLEAVERGLDHLCLELIREYRLPDGTDAAFLVDVGDEIKLGGNAMCLLALVKHSELTHSAQWLPLLEKLALGIGHLQDPQTGRFDHVLNAADLSLKQASRTPCYDGEATFGLMRLYGLTRDPRWLAMVEHAFEHFIASDHGQSHDPWLSHCVNELTRWRPLEKYFRFGIQNVSGHLDLVPDRQATLPTLLQLMLAAQKMLQRLAAKPALRHLLDDVDAHRFQRALDQRANQLLNGHFWPEMAMYFRKPQAVVGAFFVRHHSFRVRIDDVEHSLSGLVGYHAVLQARELAQAVPELQRALTPVRTQAEVVAPTPKVEADDWMLTTPARHLNWQRLSA